MKEIDLIKLWSVILNDKKNVMIITSILTLIAIVYCIFAVPIYKADIIINPPKLTDAGSGMLGSLNSMSALSGGSFLMQKNDADIAVSLFKTNSLLDMQVKKFNLVKYYNAKNNENARNILLNKTKFTPDLSSGFLMISVFDKDPKLAAAIANSYAVSLGQLISNVALGRAMSKESFYERQVKQSQQELSQAESALKDFASQHGIIAGQQSQVIVSLVSQLQAQLVVAKTRLNDISLYATTENPEYIQLEKQISGIKEQLSNLNKGQTNTDQIVIPAGLAPEWSQQYINLMRNIILREKIYTLVVEQYQSNRLDKLSELAPTAIQIVDPAQIPMYKFKPKRLMIILGSIIAGLFLGCIYVIFVNRAKILKVK